MAGIGGILQQLIGGGSYPQVPSAPYVNPQQAQLQTTSGNMAALPGLQNLGTAVDTYNLGERSRMANAAIPGFSNLANTQSTNLQSMLHGAVPTDVATQVANSAAVQALQGGYGGSGMAANLSARDLGLTSLGLQQSAGQQLPGYLGAMAGLLMPQQFNVQSGMLTPQQDISAQQWNETNRFNQQSQQAAIDSLPDPLMNAVGSFVGGLGNTAMSALGGFGGSSLGGMAGGDMGSQLGGQMGASMLGGNSYLSSLMGQYFGGQQSQQNNLFNASSGMGVG